MKGHVLLIKYMAKVSARLANIVSCPNFRWTILAFTSSLNLFILNCKKYVPYPITEMKMKFFTCWHNGPFIGKGNKKKKEWRISVETENTLQKIILD